MYPNEQKQVVTQEDAKQSSGREFLYQREAGIWLMLIQSLAVMVFVFTGILLLAYKLNWIDPLFDAGASAWVAGFGYLAFSLWKWNKLSWLETVLNVNLDRDPRVGNGKRPTMHVRVSMPDGSTRTVDTGLSEQDKSFLQAVARATLAGRPNSQTAMKKAVGMPRPKHEKVMTAFEQIRVLRKEFPGTLNSRWVLAEPESESRAVLQGIAYGSFSMLEDVWN